MKLPSRLNCSLVNSFGHIPIKLQNTIERADFEEHAAKDFRRLTTTQPVGLKYGEVVVKVVKVHKNGDKVVKVDVEAQSAAEADKVNFRNNYPK